MILCIPLIFLSGCISQKSIQNENTKYKLQKDFYIIISTYDSYNSEKGEYYRLYRRGTEIVKLELTKKDKKKINEYINYYKFYDFPKEFESLPDKNGVKDLSNYPGETIAINVHNNKNTKNVVYNSSDTSIEFKNRTKSFLEFYNIVWNIIKNKKEILELKETDYDIY